jgi:hypothetical protein
LTTGVVDTGGKFATGGINNSGNTRKINDVNNSMQDPSNSRLANNSMIQSKAESSATAGRQATAGTPGVVDSSGKLPILIFATSINDTFGKIATGVNDAGGK